MLLNNFVVNNYSSAFIERLRSYLLPVNNISPLFALQAIHRSMQTRWLVHTAKSWTTKTRSTSQTTSRYHTVPKNLYVVSSQIGRIHFPVENTRFNSFCLQWRSLNVPQRGSRFKLLSFQSTVDGTLITLYCYQS